MKNGYKAQKNRNHRCWVHEGFWSHHFITQQLPLAPELPTGSVAATCPVTTHLDIPQTHRALCALRATLGLYTQLQNELSGAIFHHSIQLPTGGAKFPQKLTFPSQHPPQGRTWPQGQPVPGQQTSGSKKCRVLVCCHKQQKQVLTFEKSCRESKFNSSQKILHATFSAWRD